MKVRIFGVHLVALSAFSLPFRWSLVVLAAVMYFALQFGFEGICHRYFSHRAYRTSRWFQFILAVWGSATGQKGMLWWADTHRQHHRHTDTLEDAHSPVHHGFWYAHVAWLWHPEHLEASIDRVKDLRAYPEIVFLDRFWELCPALMMVVLYVFGESTTIMGPGIGGVECVVWGGFMSIALSLNATWMTNSVTHFLSREAQGGFFRRRRFATNDSTNNAPFLSVLMMGSNWHNNHHRYAGAARAGFYPGELDLSFLILKLFAAVGLIWELQPVPASVLEEGLQPRAAPSAEVPTI